MRRYRDCFDGQLKGMFKEKIRAAIQKYGWKSEDASEELLEKVSPRDVLFALEGEPEDEKKALKWWYSLFTVWILGGQSFSIIKPIDGINIFGASK